MSASPNPIAEIAVAPVLTPDEERARLDLQLAQLDRLSEAGLDLARALADQPKGAGPQAFSGDIALAYSRISRAVRMTMLIQSRLLNDIQARQAMVIEARIDRDNTRFNHEQRRKGAVEDIVARIRRADPEGYDEDEIDDCVREAGERLDDDDIYGDVLTRPISDLVAQVCNDLGLDVDWPAQAQQRWAQRELASGAVGAPLIGFLASASSPAERGRGAPERGGGGIQLPPTIDPMGHPCGPAAPPANAPDG